jgi:hypothetical protein
VLITWQLLELLPCRGAGLVRFPVTWPGGHAWRRSWLHQRERQVAYFASTPLIVQPGVPSSLKLNRRSALLWPLLEALLRLTLLICLPQLRLWMTTLVGLEGKQLGYLVRPALPLMPSWHGRAALQMIHLLLSALLP